MTTVEDYKGRTYDLVAFQGVQASGMHLTPQQLVDAAFAGKICVGMAKLCQKFILEFLTPIGSMPFQQSRGCVFMQRLIYGQLSTQLDVMSAFAMSVSQVATNLASDIIDTDQDDEKFADAVLENLVITADTLALTISITSRAGTARKIILPIPVLS